MKTAFGFQFDSRYLALPECFYSYVNPMPVKAPKMVIFNAQLSNQMGLDFSSVNDKEKAEIFSGNLLVEGAAYFSQAYAGHQFGYFTILGDGRAIVWGEHINPDGKSVDIQFKGSGLTPYSRQGDGRAALGPMLREYLISEAMYYLGVPTTRSLAVIETGDIILRQNEVSGAILTRVASSHIRVGTFEFAAANNNHNLVQALLDYTIKRHYPDLAVSDNKAIALLQHVMERQADLIVDWMRIGFIHGVMNTDNMTLSGETIDYGPCAFMDFYDAHKVFSAIDHMGRYAYCNQPKIAQWNLSKLAESLLPLVHQDLNKAVDLAQETINLFPDIYQKKWLSMMRNKLGLLGKDPLDEQLIADLLDWMQKNHADFTNTFRDLSQENRPSGRLYQTKSFDNWYLRWQARLKQNNQPLEIAIRLMKRTNPALIPRNHKVEQALGAANNGDFALLYDLVNILKEPYKDDDALIEYQRPPLLSDARVYQTFCGT